MPRQKLVRSPILPVLGAVLVGWALAPREVAAKITFDSPYTLAQTYNAALRLVRVDMGLKITEKDPAAAYVMFDYKSSESGGRISPGSVEMMESGRLVKVVVQLGQMPRYHEQVLSDALQKKLRDEYGEPAERRGPPRDADAGAESGADWSQ
jgi:hypothetical protein